MRDEAPTTHHTLGLLGKFPPTSLRLLRAHVLGHRSPEPGSAGLQALRGEGSPITPKSEGIDSFPDRGVHVISSGRGSEMHAGDLLRGIKCHGD